MTNPSETIRERVSKDYSRAVNSPAEQPCCGAVDQKGVAAKLGGYAGEELADLPDDAVVNSFGCGNPVAFADVEAGQTVVDLGAGAGIDILLAAKKVGPEGRVIGIDMTDDMIARANENIRSSGLLNVEVRKGIIEDLPVDSGTVDRVISNCVINLSPEKRRVFAEIARVLKPGGRMRVSDIVASEMPDWVRNDAALFSSCISGAISEEDYIQGLRDAGLTDVKVIDRIVYDADQLSGFAQSEITGEDNAAQTEEGCGCSCGGGTTDAAHARKLADAIEGKVWSAYITATKPV